MTIIYLAIVAIASGSVGFALGAWVLSCMIRDFENDDIVGIVENKSLKGKRHG